MILEGQKNKQDIQIDLITVQGQTEASFMLAFKQFGMIMKLRQYEWDSSVEEFVRFGIDTEQVEVDSKKLKQFIGYCKNIIEGDEDK